MQADLNARILIDAPPVGPLRVGAHFAGYRADWTIAEANLKPGAATQSMAAPRILSSVPEPNRSLVADRDAAKGLAIGGAATGGMPGLTIHYHIESAGAPQK